MGAKLTCLSMQRLYGTISASQNGAVRCAPAKPPLHDFRAKHPAFINPVENYNTHNPFSLREEWQNERLTKTNRKEEVEKPHERYVHSSRWIRFLSEG